MLAHSKICLTNIKFENMKRQVAKF